MAKIVSVERVIAYSPEFKHKVVELTHRLGVETVVIAEVLAAFLFWLRLHCKAAAVGVVKQA